MSPRLPRPAAAALCVLAALISGVHADPNSHAEDDAFWADAAALLPGFDAEPAEPGPSDQDGAWSPVLPWPHTPVSAATLPNGRLLTFSGQEPQHWPGTKTQTHWALWDPATGDFDSELFLGHEMFCAHLVMRTDGTLQTMGGRYTVRDSSTYDWRDNQWGRVRDMFDRRWYTTSVALPDGDVFTVSGSGGPSTAERYHPETDVWQRLGGIDWQPVAGAPGFESHWWPYVFVAPDGRLFHFGPTEEMHWVSPDGNGSRVSANLEVPGDHYPKHAGVVMYASGKFLVAGGASHTGGGTTELCYTVDLNTTPPTVEMTDPMAFPRRFQSAVVLPTGEVLIVGGNTSGRKFSDQGTVLTPEIWNPDTGEWRGLADMSVPRNYHSTGLLLPDGRVFSGGGGYASGNPNASYTHTDAQLYTPPALFENDGRPAERPGIESAPDAVTLGSVFGVDASPDLHRFAMIRMMATTHGLSTDQRFLDIPFSESSSGEYRLVAHPNPNVMVPGYWMLFGLDEDGVYSEARIIHVKEAGDAAASGLAATYHDGAGLDDPRAERVDATVDFDYGSGSPFPGELGGDGWSTRWTGWIVPDFSENHTFHTTSDDGVRLIVDGETLIDEWTDGATGHSGAVDLTAGVPVPVTLEHFQDDGGAEIRLEWSSPRTPRTVIPARNLRVAHPANEAAVAADTRHQLFINGKLTAIGTEWRKALRSAFATGKKTTLAIRATDAEGPGGVIGHFTVNGQAVTTSSAWKVTTSAPDGWEQPGFDDSGWTAATEYGPVGSAPWTGETEGLPVNTPARWIWSEDRDGDDEVFLRLTVGTTRFAAIPDRLGTIDEPVAFTPGIINPAAGTVFSATGLPDGVEIDAATGEITGSPATQGVHHPTLLATAPDGEVASISFTWVVRLPGQGEGSLLHEAWTGIPGDRLENLLNDPRYPDSPPHTTEMTSFPTGGGTADAYGTRLRGYIHAPVTGDYTFWLSTDDDGRLLLSPDENPDHAEVIASVTGWANVEEWNKYPSQQSETVPLVGGRRYYLEILQKEGGGGDHVNLAWRRPGDEELTVVDASYLSPLRPNRAPTLEPVAGQAHTVGTGVTLRPAASDPDDDPLTFTAADLPEGLSFDGASGEIFGIPTSPGTHDVTLTARDSGGASASITFPWAVHPALELTGPDTSPRSAGESVAFAVESTGGTAPSYVWNFGDDSPEETTATPSIEHAFAAPGRHTVTLTAVDANGSETTLTFQQNVHPVRTSGTPAISRAILTEATPDGFRVWNVNPDNGTVSVHDPETGRLAEISVGDNPRALALAPDGSPWVVNKGSATISVINPDDLTISNTVDLPRASAPFGLVFSPDGSAAWLALEAAGRLAKLDPATGGILATVDVGAHPRHLSINHDGSLVYVSRFITPPAPGESTLNPDLTNAGGEIVRVRTEGPAVEGVIRLSPSTEPDSGGGARGLPNYLGPAALSPANDLAWVPSKQDNIERGTLRDGRGLTHDSTVRAISSLVDLAAQAEKPAARIDHDDAAVPSTALFGPNGLYVFVALEGSREIAVIDAYGEQELFRFPAGRAPQGLTLSPDGRTLFVHNFMSRTVTVHDVSPVIDRGVAESTLLATHSSVGTEALAPEILLGKQHFYDAVDDRLALQDYISCAACHDDGGHDGRVWDLGGFGEGLRNTIDLRGRAGTGHGPLHWSANFDEVQDFEGQIRDLSGGTGLIESANPHPPLGAPNAGRDDDLDALAAYVTSLDSFTESPHRTENGSLTPAAERGRDVFIAANCAACHGGAHFTDSGGARHDIGTLTAASGSRLGETLDGLDTPTLRGLHDGAPYLHSGSAETLADAVTAHDGVSLDAAELDDLVAYLTQIEDAEPAAPAPETPDIVVFTAEHAGIEAGDSTLLSWSVTDGGSPVTSLTLNGADVLGSTGSTVSPDSTTVFTLAATNAAGTTTATTTVEVTQPPAGGTFDDWAARFGVTGDPHADGDGDSFPEGLEFALALDPTRGRADVTTVPGADPGVHRAPRMELNYLPDGTPSFDLVFTRPDLSRPDVGYWLEATLDPESGWGIVADLNGPGATDIPSLLDITVTDLEDGTEEVRAGFRGLDSAYVRLSIDVGGGTVYSAPFGWRKRELHRNDNLIAPPFAREIVDGGNFTTTTGAGLTDPAAAWTPDEWLGHYAHVTSGSAAGAMMRITGNAAGTLTFGDAPAPLRERLAAAGSGSYVIRPCDTPASLFGRSNQAELLSGTPDDGDLISFVNPDGSFSDHYYRTEGLGGTGWRGTADPFTNTADRPLTPGDGFLVDHPSETSIDLYFHGELVLGPRLRAVRPGISILGSQTPVEHATLNTLGLNPFFTPNPDGTLTSDLYLETSSGALYSHYRKDATLPGGTGWRLFFDPETSRDDLPIDAGEAWLLFRSGAAGLWERPQPFAYPAE